MYGLQITISNGNLSYQQFCLLVLVLSAADCHNIECTIHPDYSSRFVQIGSLQPILAWWWNGCSLWRDILLYFLQMTLNLRWCRNACKLSFQMSTLNFRVLELITNHYLRCKLNCFLLFCLKLQYYKIGMECI